MKLPHGLSPIWLSIPAIVFMLVISWFVTRLPVFRAATIQNPEGSGIFKPSPNPKLYQSDGLTEIRQELDNFSQIEAAMQMPVIDRQISLPID